MRGRIMLLAMSILLCLISTSYTGLSAEVEFISPEKASDIIHNLPEVKNLLKKYDLVGYGFGMGVRREPTEDQPFYIIEVSVTKEQERAPQVYEAKQIFSKYFYVDAYSGKVVSQKEMEEKVAVIEKEWVIQKQREWKIKKQIQRQKEQAQKDKEKILGEEIDRLRLELNEKRISLPSEEYEEFVKESMPVILKGLDAFTPEIRGDAAWIIGQLAAWTPGYKAEETVPRLIELLKDEYYGARYEAVFALGKIGDKKVTVFILPLLNDTDSLVRRGTIRTLSELGDTSLTPMLIKLLEDTGVHQEAVRALARVGDARAVEPLIKLFSNKDYFYLERDIIYTLGNIGDKKSIPFLIGLFDELYTVDPRYGKEFIPGVTHMGKEAADALVNIGEESISQLIEALKSTQLLTRLYSAYTLGKIKTPLALEPLNKALNVEKDPTVEIYIKQALAEIKGEKFIPPPAKLKVWVKSSKQKYKSNEAIKLFLYIQNKRTTPIIINTAPTKFADVSFKIIAPDGKPVIYMGPICFRSLFPTKENLKTLKPKEVYKTGSFPIQEYYSFATPGKYQIIGVYENRFNAIEFGVYAWVGEVESEPISIEIK